MYPHTTDGWPRPVVPRVKIPSVTGHDLDCARNPRVSYPCSRGISPPPVEQGLPIPPTTTGGARPRTSDQTPSTLYPHKSRGSHRLPRCDFQRSTITPENTSVILLSLRSVDTDESGPFRCSESVPRRSESRSDEKASGPTSTPEPGKTLDSSKEVPKESKGLRLQSTLGKRRRFRPFGHPGSPVVVDGRPYRRGTGSALALPVVVAFRPPSVTHTHTPPRRAETTQTRQSPFREVEELGVKGVDRLPHPSALHYKRTISRSRRRLTRTPLVEEGWKANRPDRGLCALKRGRFSSATTLPSD